MKQARLKVVIPTEMRKSVLTKIYEGHLGIEKCRRWARSLLYWPGLNSSITEMINKCSTCLMFSANQQADELQPHDLPVHPWQNVDADIFTHSGMDYLVVTPSQTIQKLLYYPDPQVLL